jgi:uncharacterized protein (TIGR03437 family)
VLPRYLAGVSCIALWLWAQSTPTIDSVVNGATGVSSSAVPVAARGSNILIRGHNLASTTASAGAFPLPPQLAGTQVTIGGIAAPLLSVSPTQISLQVPFEIPNSSAVDLIVQSGNTASAPLTLTILAQDIGYTESTTFPDDQSPLRTR